MPTLNTKKILKEANISAKSECIQVIVRIRPLNNKEKSAGYKIYKISKIVIK